MSSHWYTRRRFIAGAATGAVGGFAGCGGDGSSQETESAQTETDADTETETPTEPPTETDAPTETATEEAAYDPVDWPTYQYTAGNLGVTSETTGPSESMSVEWTYDLGTPTQGSLALVDGTVFVGSGNPEGDVGGVHAVNAATGEQEWMTDLSGPVQGTPTVDAGLAFVGNDSGTLFALNTASGDEYWRYEFRSGTRVASPDVNDGTVFVGTAGGRVEGISSTNGSRQWTYRSGGGIGRPVGYANGAIYVGDQGSTIHGLQEDSENAWTYDVSNGSISGVASDGRSVVGAARKGSVVALNTNGRLIWQFDTDAAIEQNPVVDGDWTYFGTVDGELYGLRGGLEEWNTSIDAALVNSPVLIGDTLYFVSEDGRIFAISADTGETQWTASVDARVVNSTPIASDGRLFVTAMDGTLYALEP